VSEISDYEPRVYDLPPPDRGPADEAPKRNSIVGLILLVAGFVALAVFLPYWAIFAFAVIVMIFLHELGHYITAKWSDMKVTEFFIGFGPRIGSFRRGETEYGVKAIPAGAYVKVIGMNNLEEVDPADEPRTYRAKSYPRRLAVGVAGSAMHFLIALVSLFVLLSMIGLPGGKLGASALTDEGWIIDTVDPSSAAGQAGIEPGDQMVSIDGQPVATFDELRQVVVDRPGDDVEILVERDGEEVVLDATLGSRLRNGDREGFLGVSPTLPTITYGPVEAAGRSVVEFGRITRLTGQSLVQFFSPSGLAEFFGEATGDEPAVPPSGGGGESVEGEGSNRVLSILGALRLGAELTETGFANFLQFFIMLNVFVGVFNLIPLLPLDGGHVAIATYERLRSRNGKRYHADVAKMLPVAYAVVAILVVVGVTALYLDIVDPLSLSD
jgi:membrane-associated protease RseP (regulator of RpoE activity)